jgi:hypothetical protein
MKLIKILSIVFVLSFVANSCDKIDAPYQTGFDCEKGTKNVLIEDYTGHTCVNCPSAAATAHNIKENCEERVIIIAVHAGYFSEPKETGLFTYDFRTPAGNDWNDFFGIKANPNGVVNRQNESGNYILGPGQWAEAAFKELGQESPVQINIENTFDVNRNSLSTKVSANFTEDVTGNYKLIVCITENNIIKPQKNNDPNIGTTPDIDEYEHMHVLRSAINGTWGQTFIEGSVKAGQTITKTNNQSFEGTDWVAGNCNVVAFIYDESDKSILQVEEEKIIIE